MDYPTLNLVTTLLPVLTLIPGVIELIAQWASNKRVSRWCPLVLSVAHFPLLFVAPTFIGDTLAGDIPRIASSYGAPESSLEILGVIGVIGIQASIIRSQKRKICDAFDAEPATGPSVAPARPPDQLDARDIEDHDRVLREWIASGKPGEKRPSASSRAPPRHPMQKATPWRSGA